ncbi:MAG: DUF2961 domain-containing protein [Opitutaceae bacterium]|nr:DUF2961 domain-containing protein [Opitutaceae bacterium]
MNPDDLCKIRPGRSLMQNSLWHWDAYPELPDLLPHSAVELGRFSGPGVVRTIHLTLNMEGGERTELLRGVFLRVRYDGQDIDSVWAPVGDFFCDSFGSESMHFASIVMAKRPTNSLFCYLPMPFRDGVELSLVNTTDKPVLGYGYVTAETLPAWADDTAYFHARWLDRTIDITREEVPLLNTAGRGHLLGCHLTAVSRCPHFARREGICEGNDEFYVDGAEAPACNYLGTEDFFGFSWSWNKVWADNHSGTTYLGDQDGETRLACYRFLLNDPVRFTTALRARINYEHEINNPYLKLARAEGNGQVNFGIVTYWYQDKPVDATKV